MPVEPSSVPAPAANRLRPFRLASEFACTGDRDQQAVAVFGEGHIRR